jgi:hypothetical protein
MFVILSATLPFTGAVFIQPEVAKTLEVQMPRGSIVTEWITDGIIGESLAKNDGLFYPNSFHLFVHPSSLGKLDEHVQQEGTCFVAPDVLKDVQTDIFYFPTVSLGASNYSILPESLGTKTSVAWAYCVEINPATWNTQPLGPDLMTEVPSHWCIGHYFDISAATVWYWDEAGGWDSERPLLGFFEHNEDAPMMFKEFLIGESSYYTTASQTHTVSDGGPWILHLGYQYSDSSIKLSSDPTFCEVQPLQQ